MLPIFGGKKPKDIREFVSRFAEATLTFLFYRFDIDMGQIELATIEVLNAVDADLAAVPGVADMASFLEDPEALAMSFSENRAMRARFLPEGPRTAESITEGTIALVKALSRAQFVLSAVLND